MEMRICRLAAWLLSGCLLLSGCQTVVDDGTTGTTSSPTDLPSGSGQSTVATALCWSKTDTVNPYKAITRVNRELATLLYQGLTAVKPDWTTELVLAKSVEQTDPTHLTVHLKDGAVFSDGTPITETDVTQSFSLAVSSGEYAELVSNIRSVTSRDGILTVTLRSPDVVNPIAALSFPIIRVAQNGEVLGSGPYRLENNKLIDNPHDDRQPAESVWELQDLTQRKDMRYALAAGNIAVYTTDMTDSQPPVISGDMRQTTVLIGHLIYLGINNNRTPYNSAIFRAGLSSAFSRSTIADNAFAGYAVPATTPFLPTWGPAIGLDGAENQENIEQTVAKWKELGYNVLDGGVGKSLPSPKLLVQKDNAFHLSAASLIAEQLSRAGLSVTVEAVSAADYRSRLRYGNFDLYLGEIRMSDDGSLRPWLTTDGAANAGVPATATASYAAYLAGEQTLTEFCRTFVEEWPFIPVVWRTGVAVCTTRLQGLEPSGSDFYYHIENWTL